MAKRELHSYKGRISLTLKDVLIIFILIYDFSINQPSNSMWVIKCAKNKGKNPWISPTLFYLWSMVYDLKICKTKCFIIKTNNLIGWSPKLENNMWSRLMKIEEKLHLYLSHQEFIFVVTTQMLSLWTYFWVICNYPSSPDLSLNEYILIIDIFVENIKLQHSHNTAIWQFSFCNK